MVLPPCKTSPELTPLPPTPPVQHLPSLDSPPRFPTPSPAVLSALSLSDKVSRSLSVLLLPLSNSLGPNSLPMRWPPLPPFSSPEPTASSPPLLPLSLPPPLPLSSLPVLLPQPIFIQIIS